MILRGKFGFYLLIIMVVLSLVLIAPALSQSSLGEIIEDWMADYNEAVEIAQDDDDDDDDDDGGPLDAMMVRVDDDISDYAGIELLKLSATQFSPESKAMAKVLGLQALLKLRNHYFQTLSEANVATVVENSRVMELKRLKSLARSTAAKNINLAQAALDEARAESRLLKANVQAAKDEINHLWGQEVAAWLLEKNSKAWQRLLTYKDSLLLVTLPVGVFLPDDVSIIRVARNGKQQSARKAYLVSPARISEQNSQGETYFFKTAGANLREGMRLEAWFSLGKTPVSGVFIPDSAMVWNEGQAWAYIQVDEDLYQRRSLQTGIATEGGVIIESGIQAAEQLVIQGAQMLLSEEFRWQILDEDDD